MATAPTRSSQGQGSVKRGHGSHFTSLTPVTSQGTYCVWVSAGAWVHLHMCSVWDDLNRIIYIPLYIALTIFHSSPLHSPSGPFLTPPPHFMTFVAQVSSYPFVQVCGCVCAGVQVCLHMCSVWGDSNHIPLHIYIALTFFYSLFTLPPFLTPPPHFMSTAAQVSSSICVW